MNKVELEYFLIYLNYIIFLWMWELDDKESWVPKNWCFWTVVWRLLRVPWIVRRSSQSIRKEISPVFSLEALMLKLKLQYLAIWCEELTHRKRPWCWARLKVGGEGDIRGWDGWMASLTRWKWVWVSSESWCRTRKPGMLQSLGSQKVGHDWATDLNTYDMYVRHNTSFPMSKQTRKGDQSQMRKH